ncbi:MAG: DNA gyrase subunit B [Candidatus Micrarchaeota archaeon]|nr:DNA gyrase subunit B [Candidatus Micrarchaeota archaeon]
MDYSAKDIKVLEGVEAVRKRPAMYIGDTGKKGFHHLLFEILDNAVDEYLAGYADHIKVELGKKWAAVEDNGRGIPVDIHPEKGKSALELIATTLHAGGKFDRKSYKYSGGLHGVGVTVVNALSEEMEIISKRDGKIYRQKYRRGIPITPVEVIGETNETGTRVYFKPDPEIFGDQEFDVEVVRERLKELSFLSPGLTLELHYDGKKEVYRSEKGILELFENVLYEPIYFEDDWIKVAFSHSREGGKILLYTNNIRNYDGTHYSGIKSAFVKVINDYLAKQGKKTRIIWDDIERDLVLVLSIYIPNPQFEGQTKWKLNNPEIKGKVESFFYNKLKEWIEKNDPKPLIEKILDNYKIRKAIERAKEVEESKISMKRSIIPGKLADAALSDREKTELFIVEGESAGGSAKMGRDKFTQAVLALRGKILNVEKSSINKIIKNQEIKNIFAALGIDFKGNLDNLRYGKVIIMTDADVDGSHIRSLLLALLYRYARPLIEQGRVYSAMPPLYKITVGGKHYYAYSDEEKEKILKEHEGKKATVQRYKGLGEMNPDQLWETTMNPETRNLKQITLQNAEEADRLISLLLGEDVEARRNFIITHANLVKELDV